MDAVSRLGCASPLDAARLDAPAPGAVVLGDGVLEAEVDVEVEIEVGA